MFESPNLELDGTKLTDEEAAERWRRAGEVIRASNPDAFRRVFAIAEGLAAGNADPHGHVRTALAEGRAVPDPNAIPVEYVHEIDGTKLPPHEADGRWIQAGRAMRELLPDEFRRTFAQVEGQVLIAQGLKEPEDVYRARVALVTAQKPEDN